MRRWLPLAPLALLLLVPFASARAGLFGTDAPGRIPVPAHEFGLRVEDKGGVVVDLAHATFDGEVFLFGTVGLAQVTVPFENVRTIEVGPGADEDHVTATVLVKTGETQVVVVETDRPIYGRTSFGNYKIEIGQVRRVSTR